MLSVLSLLLFTVSCKKTKPAIIIQDGNYTGTFVRETIAAVFTSQVTMRFSGSTWSGQSQLTYFPALCNGSYKLDGADSIDFENACIWPANFDWTLILGGSYKIDIVGGTIEISRAYNSAFKDVYRLTKL
jgi:hypothetical protein